MTIPQPLDLALQHHQAGRLAEAEAIYRQILAVAPHHAEALHFLGVMACQAGRNEDGVEWIRRAIAVAPGVPNFHLNLGTAYQQLRRHAEAIAAFRQAIALRPGYAEAHYNLGVALSDVGALVEAIESYHTALSLRSHYPAALSNLGADLNDQGRFDEAEEAFRRAIALRSDYPEAINNLGNTLKNKGSMAEAIAAFGNAISLEPRFAGAHSNLVYALNFHAGRDSLGMATEARRWNDCHAAPLQPSHRPHRNSSEPTRRLRVGYVSPNFTRHVICHFLLPLLEAHDHARFDIFCYASVKRPDAVTARIKATADAWRDVLGLSDDALAEKIREDQIDILVDLTQHMANQRLLVFARKPAPVQVAWLGYPGSTGLPAIDYRLTDTFMEPEGAAWSESVEKPVRLPDSWFCFDPIDEYPEPGPLPALTAAHVTFGSLNNFCKVNDDVLRLWAQVLQNVDASKLLMQCPAGETQARVRRWFEAAGIASHRIELVERTASRAEFLQLFNRIDIALETFPYNGGTTTCEALWMGVPVPTFPGSTIVSRIGLSILSAAGMQEFTATDPAEYLRLTASLAADLPKLAALRSTLRQRMKASAFMDAPRFARNVEQAYREMWGKWCAGRVTGAPE